MATLSDSMALAYDSAGAAFGVARYPHDAFSVDTLVRAKESSTVTVLIPARDEESTIGQIVDIVRSDLMKEGGARLVDDLVVVDDRSTDATAGVARSAGATVVAGPGLGKGEAMRHAKGRGDIVVFLDGDVQDFSSHFVVGLLGPLLLRPELVLVKGAYERVAAGTPAAGGGGRVTELVAKPLLSLLFPGFLGLDKLSQPLAGETAIRQGALSEIELEAGYGVEIGLLIDVATRYGPSAIAEVDLGSRRHRNRPLSELAPQAKQVLAAALSRATFPPLEGDR